ncbi:PREDICTED: putative gustatory receptor 2a [Atta cephalotes]|uniref:Gustatory receptor n=1 Tax=Atta cephalotes TaxID=12957 RepID=A0A158NE42_ATTCE|nr:PREDICTED: putative gustatory receptor 2a [Atta cephalotes]
MSIPYRINDDYDEKTNLTVGIEVLQTVLGALVICVILISYCIDQKFLVRIANQLIIIEYEIDRLYDLYYSLRRQRIFYTIIIVCILKICLLILLLCTEILGIQTSPVSWLTDVLPTFYVGWLLIQYFLLVMVIQTDFADSLYQTRRIVVNNSVVHQLLQLRDVHCHLCKMSNDVSSFYSLPVLFGIIFLFLTLIYNGYWILSPLLMKTLDYGTLSNGIIWIIFLIYPISLLTNRITSILIEIKTTGNIVHDLLNCAIGKETKTELKKFSLQLLHRKIQFTANGYFILDNTFLHSLIGTMVTYLVILVQFQMTSLFSSVKQQIISSCNSTRRDLK